MIALGQRIKIAGTDIIVDDLYDNGLVGVRWGVHHFNIPYQFLAQMIHANDRRIMLRDVRRLVANDRRRLVDPTLVAIGIACKLKVDEATASTEKEST